MMYDMYPEWGPAADDADRPANALNQAQLRSSWHDDDSRQRDDAWQAARAAKPDDN